MKTTLYLVRHGLTAANKNDVFAGRTQEPLHAEGCVQLEEIGKKLAGRGISRIFCGPLLRTRQSARILSALVSASVEERDSLNEISIPHWDGLSKTVIRRRFENEYPIWLSDPAGFCVTGCETIAKVQNRAVACLEEIFADYSGQNLLVVSHLIVIRTLLLYYLRRPNADFREIKIGNAQMVRFERDEFGETMVGL